MKRKDYKLTWGCANCRHYAGKSPPNVPNFKCSAGIGAFKVFYCEKFAFKKQQKMS